MNQLFFRTQTKEDYPLVRTIRIWPHLHPKLDIQVMISVHVIFVILLEWGVMNTHSLRMIIQIQWELPQLNPYHPHPKLFQFVANVCQLLDQERSTFVAKSPFSLKLLIWWKEGPWNLVAESHAQFWKVWPLIKVSHPEGGKLSFSPGPRHCLSVWERLKWCQNSPGLPTKT